MTAGISTLATLSPEQRELAVSLERRNPTLDALYSLSIYNLETNADLAIGDFGLSENPDPKARSNNMLYVFSVAPKAEDVDEPFATTITHTQNRGKFVESHGSIKKSLRVSGTTGLRPNKITNKDGSFSPSENTGFDDIIFLRNLFRLYSDLKEDSSFSHRLAMAWYNFKDGEYWICEPTSIRVSRNSRAPTMYDYTFTLELLSPLRGTLLGPESESDPIAKKQREFGKSTTDIVASAKAASKYTYLASQRLLTLRTKAQLFQTKVLAPVNNVMRQVIGVRNQLVLSPTELASSSIRAVGSVLEFVDDVARTPLFVRDQLGAVRRDAYFLTHLARRAAVSLERLATTPGLQTRGTMDVEGRFNRRANAYREQGGVPDSRPTPRGPSFIGNQNAPTTFSRGVVQLGETIRDAAERLTGSANNWRILVTINDLRAPYVATERAPGVLAYGDVILYPGVSSGTSGGVSTIRQSPNENSNLDTSPLSPNEIAYGRDVRAIINDADGMVDLAISQSGDIATVIGIPNVVQALQIKFFTEVGELPAHPRFGARISIGRKATAYTVAVDRVNALNTLLSDTRVASVPDLSIVTDGDIATLNSTILLTEASDTINASFALRND